jgi:hypothetical protein
MTIREDRRIPIEGRQARHKVDSGFTQMPVSEIAPRQGVAGAQSPPEPAVVGDPQQTEVIEPPEDASTQDALRGKRPLRPGREDDAV